MAPPKGKSNNPSGKSRDGHGQSMTRRERAALDHENTGSRAKRIKAIKLRGRDAGH
jgi:hypothetical protein